MWGAAITHAQLGRPSPWLSAAQTSSCDAAEIARQHRVAYPELGRVVVTRLAVPPEAGLGPEVERRLFTVTDLYTIEGGECISAEPARLA